MSRTASPKLAGTSSGTPPTIRRKRTPRGFSRYGKSTSEHIIPIAQIGYENCRHLVPQRFPIRLERPTTARLIDLNRSTVSGVRNMSSTLRKLDISCLALRSVPDEMISTLYYLERLDMSYNLLEDEGIPEKLRELDDLIDFDVSHNRLTQLPKVLLKLKKISRLKVGHNQLKTINGIEKLRRLVQLVLEHNQIDSIPKDIYGLKRLEYLHLATNSIRNIDSDVKNLKHTKIIDISNNKLAHIPSELFLLPQLELLNLSHNKISKMPQLTVRGKPKRLIENVDLSANELKQFPEFLLQIVRVIDLSANQIRVVPQTALKRLDLQSGQQLNIKNNPMSNPPPEIADDGVKGLVQFFTERRSEMTVFRGLKILLIGPKNSGKTSLIQSMIDQTSRLTEKGESTVGVTTHNFSIPHDPKDTDPMAKCLPVALWDFSGNTHYLYTHNYFLHEPSLIMLTFNIKKYNEEYFQKEMTPWLDWVICRINKLHILAVGTHCDQIDRSRSKEICQKVSERLRKYAMDHLVSIERDVRRIEDRRYIPQALRAQLQKYIELLEFPYSTDTAVAFSSANLFGMEDLQRAIIKKASNKECYPLVTKTIPTLWVDVEYYIEEKGDDMQLPLVRFDDYKAEIINKFGMQHLIIDITRYLHDIGKVIWYSEHPFLSKWIILRPSWLCEVLNALFKHDFEKVDFHSDEVFKQVGIAETRFLKIKQDRLRKGTITRDLLRALWANSVPTEINRPMFRVLFILLEYFHIGFPVQKPTDRQELLSATKKETESSEGGKTGRSSASKRQRPTSATSSKSTRSQRTIGEGDDWEKIDTLHKITRFCIPWLIEESQTPPEFKKDYESTKGNPSVAIVFRFSNYTPPGIFENFVVSANDTKHSLVPIHIWRGGLYCKSLEKPVKLYMKNMKHEDGSSCMRFEVVHDINSELDETTEDIWNVLLPILYDAEGALSNYKGCRYERYTECPKCHKLSFLGEWSNPKELQDLSTKQCDACKAHILTQYIVQPKERNLVEEMLMQKLMENGEDDEGNSEVQEPSDSEDDNENIKTR
ncbi:DgyrCDS8529 [Dimorphilus gyrociliatus]|uniref:non-specific serine/threonine protein kinase n=1 Tax=Dimorphilus gyrociliatus TaxID=2664684 RepID=A0A7I8VVX2_9ANNE|nr:DgyrCDS8529 [Dimorphilus gyrociliatus]